MARQIQDRNIDQYPKGNLLAMMVAVSDEAAISVVGDMTRVGDRISFQGAFAAAFSAGFETGLVFALQHQEAAGRLYDQIKGLVTYVPHNNHDDALRRRIELLLSAEDDEES